MQDLSAQRLAKLLSLQPPPDDDRYEHWDRLRHKTPPHGLSSEEWWVSLKMRRSFSRRYVPLVDRSGRPFHFTMPDLVLQAIHTIDRDAAGNLASSEQVTNPDSRDRYIISSLIEEATTSSQLEGAATTRDDARRLLRSGRRPRDRDEQMIVNNYAAIDFVRNHKNDRLTKDIVFELHHLVTRETLDKPDAAGRFRRPDEAFNVWDERDATLLHVPPAAESLPERLDALCTFADEDTSGFLHPVLRSIVLHFWVGFDHPFVDGNGRVARALFYWCMLHNGYWLAEYVSISSILRKAQVAYARSFLHTETDENDLTYFLIYNLRVLRRALDELDRYLRKKAAELQRVESLLRLDAELNHRQLALIGHALRHPHGSYTIESHLRSHGVVYQTARTDLLALEKLGLLDKRKRGKKYYFSPPADLAERLSSESSD